MRSFGTLLLAFLVSGFVAGMLQLQIGVALKADLELVLAMLLLWAMTLLTTVALGIALGAAGHVTTINHLALGLIGLAVLAAAALLTWDFVAARGFTRGGLALVAEITVPLPVMIAIQWWLVRRRWRRVRGA
jgi:hypothetical protein